MMDRKSGVSMLMPIAMLWMQCGLFGMAAIAQNKPTDTKGRADMSFPPLPNRDALEID